MPGLQDVRSSFWFGFWLAAGDEQLPARAWVREAAVTACT